MFEFLETAWNELTGGGSDTQQSARASQGGGYDQQAQALKPPVGRATTTANLKLRGTPEGEKLLLIPKGARVDVLQKGEWAQVRYNGTVGYSHSDYLQEDAPATPGGGDPEPIEMEPIEVTGGDPVEAPTDAPGAEPAGETTAAALKKQRYTVSSDKVRVVKEDKKKKIAEVRESPQTYCNAILKAAGQDPDSWYGSFTKITFLGRRMNAPIHTALAEHLQSVEASFATKYGGGDPKAAGDALGLTNEVIKGSREKPTSAAFSMHLLGLAIDLDYTHNPFIGTSANPVFARAGNLVNGAPGKYKSGMSWDQLNTLDELTETYFGYLENEGALKTALAGASGEWAGKSAADARTVIEADLAFVQKKWSRKNSEAKRNAVKYGGFMNLSKELVEGIGLDWGGKYGDMMHFDMRNKGVGKKVRSAISAYKKKKTAEGKDAWGSED